MRELIATEKKQIKKHELWANGKEGGERADFSGHDFSGADLNGADLTDANLRRADLRDANLCKCIVCDANFDGAIVSYRGGVCRIRFEDVR